MLDAGTVVGTSAVYTRTSGKDCGRDQREIRSRSTPICRTVPHLSSKCLHRPHTTVLVPKPMHLIRFYDWIGISRHGKQN